MADPYADAIAAIESGGRYNALGPTTRSGDRAYGRYQIMGSNVGPWSQQVLGRSLTPEQFLADPAAQDAVFSSQFGNYVKKYGPEGAARAWFAGERGMNNPNARDMLGTSVADYGSRFMAGLPSAGLLGQSPGQPMGQAQTQPAQVGQTIAGILGNTPQAPQQAQGGTNFASLAAGLLNPKPQQFLQPQMMAPMPRKRIDLSALQAMANG